MRGWACDSAFEGSVSSVLRHACNIGSEVWSNVVYYMEDVMLEAVLAEKPALYAESVSLVYSDGTRALENLNLRLRFGELVFLTGESGSGKTSTISLALGAFRPDSGVLQVLGRDMNAVNDNEIRLLRQECGVIFQNLRLIKHQSAIENVALPLRFISQGSAGGKAGMYSKASEALAKVGLSGMEDKRAALLSGGEQQRVAIARAIAAGARLIIADEPTGNLDPENALGVMRILENLADDGAAVLVTTHALALVELMKNRRHYKIERGVSSEV